MSDRLAKIIKNRRRRDGMIRDLPDVDLVFAEGGRVVDAVPEDAAFTHTLIEMFMVEANEAVGRLFAKLEVPVLRRTHLIRVGETCSSCVLRHGSPGWTFLRTDTARPAASS